MKPSATVAISQRAKELKAEGVDVLSFSVGEPDFETPEYIRQAVRDVIDTGCSHYTFVAGIQSLREAICEVSKRRRGGHAHTPDEVVVSVGAKHSLFNLALALFEAGDEVITPAPHWVSYPAQVELVGATPVVAKPDASFKLTPEELSRVTTDKTKALLLCSPSNPTGAAYTPKELRALMDVAAKSDYWIIVDEIYSQLVYEGFEQKSVLEVAPELRDRIIIVDGLSKTYAMTGWRMGWFLGPEHVAKACTKIQGQSTTNPAAISQYAALAALTGPQDDVERMRQAFEERRGIIVEGLNAIDGIECATPEGAFYAFPNVQALLGRSFNGKTIEDDLALAGFLLDEAKCALVPGSAFGAPGYLRMSYATSPAQIHEGLSRIRDAVSKLT